LSPGKTGPNSNVTLDSGTRRVRNIYDAQLTPAGHPIVKGLNRATSRHDEGCRNQRVNQTRHATDDHLEPEARSDPLMLPIRLTDRGRVLEKDLPPDVGKMTRAMALLNASRISGHRDISIPGIGLTRKHRAQTFGTTSRRVAESQKKSGSRQGAQPFRNRVRDWMKETFS
jgi:hypothetical protein